MDKSKSIWVLVNRSFIEVKVQNNQSNKLFERAWPLRLVALLSAQALLKSTLLFRREKVEGKNGGKSGVMLKIKPMQDAAVNWSSKLT